MDLKLVYGEGEIKRIDSQIKKALSLIDGRELGFLSRGEHERNKKIKQLGFDTATSSGVAFLGKRQVIKIGLFTTSPPDLKFRVPTLFYSYDKVRWGNWVYVVAIQPRVRIMDDLYSDKMYDIVNDLYNKTRCDVHRHNVGIYRNRPVLFDW